MLLVSLQNTWGSAQDRRHSGLTVISKEHHIRGYRTQKIIYTRNKDTITHVLRPASVNHRTKVPPTQCLTIKMRWPDGNDFTQLDEESRSSFVRCANFTSKMRHDYIKSDLASRSVRLTMLILGYVLDTISVSAYKYISNHWSFKIIRQALTLIVCPNDWFIDWW